MDAKHIDEGFYPIALTPKKKENKNPKEKIVYVEKEQIQNKENKRKENNDNIKLDCECGGKYTINHITDHFKTIKLY